MPPRMVPPLRDCTDRTQKCGHLLTVYHEPVIMHMLCAFLPFSLDNNPMNWGNRRDRETDAKWLRGAQSVGGGLLWCCGRTRHRPRVQACVHYSTKESRSGEGRGWWEARRTRRSPCLLPARLCARPEPFPQIYSEDDLLSFWEELWWDRLTVVFISLPHGEIRAS